MQVINLVSWAGADFSYSPGQIIDLPDATAEARIAAGLASRIATEAPAPTPKKRAR